MEIVGENVFLAFGKKHPDARKALARWAKVVEQASWNNFSDLRRTFGSADYVKGHVVFNVGGNKFRVVASVDYEVDLVVIECALTHKQYSTGEWI